MDFSSATKSLLLNLPGVPTDAGASSSANEDDNSSLNGKKSDDVTETTESLAHVVSPEKDNSEDEEKEEGVKPCILQRPEEFFDCQEEEDDGSVEFMGTKKSFEDEMVWIQKGEDIKKQSTKPYNIKKGVSEFIYYDDKTGEYVGWKDNSTQHQNTNISEISSGCHLRSISDPQQNEPEEDLGNNTSSHTSECADDLHFPDSEDDDEDEEDVSSVEDEDDPSNKSGSEDEEINSVGCAESEEPFVEDNTFDDDGADANAACLKPGEFLIEEWHGCRVDGDGEKQFLIKWEGFSKKQWMRGDFFFREENATAAAIEELKDKCQRFPPCHSCVSSDKPHVCWSIEEYTECTGIYGRKVVDGITNYKIKWSSNEQDAWVVAGQFNEPSWAKVQEKQKQIKCIDCDRGNENHTCSGNFEVVAPRLKAAATFKPKPLRRQLPTRAQSSSSRAKSVSSKRKRYNQTPNAKSKKQRTSTPRKAAEPPCNPAPFFVGGSPFRLGNQLVKEISFQSDEGVPERDCLASCFFENRLRCSPWYERRGFPTTRELTEAGDTWQLIYTIEPPRPKGVYTQHRVIPQKRGPIKVCYVSMQGRHDSTVMNLRHELEKLGDFSVLSAEKVVARIKLLFTDAKATNFKSQPRCIFSTPTAIYSEIEERGNDGCGFFSRELMTQLFNGKRLQEKFKNTVAMMVRIVCPKLGIFKGVLMLKDDPVNLVELPPSMRKVLPSRHDDLKGTATLLIKATFPSKPNIALEKYWKTNHITKADRTERERGLSDGIVQFLRKALKVKDGELQNIRADAKKLGSNRHGTVLGVADCTNAIPAGTVYFSGFRNIPNFQAALQRKAVFVCRHPCAERADARRLTILTDQPVGMSKAQWDFLETMPFGLIMFGFTVGRCAIPPQIANGDLDGDLYFVSWDQRLIDLDLIPVSIDACEEQTETNERMPNPNWLESAYDLMTDVENSEKYGKLMGTFHGLWKKSNNELDDADYCQAYKMSLDIRKHGGKITLPRRSWDEVKLRKLHSFLKEPECPELTEILHRFYSRAINESQRSELLHAYKESLKSEARVGAITLPERWWNRIPVHLHVWLRNESRQNVPPSHGDFLV